jgi:hypothetical protein
MAARQARETSEANSWGLSDMEADADRWREEAKIEC